VLEDNVCSFRVNPPGEHDETPIGGDRDKSPGAEHSSGGAVTGAAVGAIAGAAAGAVISPVLGPVAIAGGAGAGAYAGALVGAMAATDRHTHRDEMRPAETLVAVNVGMGEIPEARVIEIFEQCGAQQVERAEGMWADGEWADFDPVTAPRLVHPDTPQRRQGI
jgi:phage tail tape-measure protein